jgi:hypothetical protein
MIQDYLKAGYPALMVRTHEPERFIGSVVKKINGRTPYQWDLVQGYRELGNGAEWQQADAFDLPDLAARGKEKAVWFLRNFHFSIKEPVVIQAIQNNLPAYKAKGITLVMVAPDAELPPELEREVVVLDELEKRIAQIESWQEFEPTPGSFCGWCGVIAHCLVMAKAIVPVNIFYPTTRGDAVQAATLLLAIQTMDVELKNNLKRYVKESGPVFLCWLLWGLFLRLRLWEQVLGRGRALEKERFHGKH